MILFQGSIEATAETYSKTAAIGKATIDQLTHQFRNISCVQHPFYHVHAQVHVSETTGTAITLTNSCCESFSHLFDKTLAQCLHTHR